MTKTPEIDIDRLLVRLKEAARLARSEEDLRVRASAAIEEVMSKLGIKKDVNFSPALEALSRGFTITLRR